MIPKIIHYCWFGGNPLPKLAIKCIKSWKKYCSDYEIIEWNENNFNINEAPLYVRQAYEAQKWAFVTDYVRLWAMVKYGGVYMDTDVEVVKSIDQFLVHKAFSGFEDGIHIPTGIMACEKGFPLFKTILNYYNEAKFKNIDGSLNLMTNVTMITEICLGKGLVQNGEYQIIEEFVIYPKDYFCPMSYDSGILMRTDNTATIHWFAGSWQSTETKQEREARLNEHRKIELVHYVCHIPNRIIRKMIGIECYEKLKERFKRH